jgi:hypothetical protein
LQRTYSSGQLGDELLGDGGVVDRVDPPEGLLRVRREPDLTLGVTGGE